MNGIIIKVEYGYNRKHTHPDKLYLLLIIQQCNGWYSNQYYKGERTGEVLRHFGEDTIQKLQHKTVELHEMPNNSMNPDRIRLYYKDEWLENDNRE